MVSTFHFKFMVNHKLMTAVLFFPFTFLFWGGSGSAIIMQNIFKAPAVSHGVLQKVVNWMEGWWTSGSRAFSTSFESVHCKFSALFS